MKRLAIVFAVLSVLAASSANAKKPTRVVMHTFQDSSAIIIVAIVDQTGPPQGVVSHLSEIGEKMFVFNCKYLPNSR